MDESSSSSSSKRAQVVLAFVVFATFNIGLVEFNSAALRDDQYPGFHFPIFYTMFHMLVSSLAALLIMATIAPPSTGFPSFGQLYEYLDGLALIAACTTLNVGLNNISLTIVSLLSLIHI